MEPELSLLQRMDLHNKSVLITGADGFIGSHLTEMALGQAKRVRALALYNSFNSWGWLDDLRCLKDVEVISGDVRDPRLCRTLCEDIDVVLNLAALIAIPYSYVAPASYVDTNVIGALNICQACLDTKVERLVQMSSSEVYGTARYVPIDEKHPFQPQSPYSATKIAADALVRSFFYAHKLPVIVARPFNTYGPRQSARAVIPTIITQIASGASEVRLGDTTPTRNLNHVEDTCRGLLALAACDEAVGEEVNIGTEDEISVEALFHLIARLMQRQVAIKEDETRRRPVGSEVLRLACDSTKLRHLTGFKPQYKLEQGLAHTIPWFLDPDNLKKYKAGVYNV
jgi:NAD dependent epimerase/dehydratase